MELQSLMRFLPKLLRVRLKEWQSKTKRAPKRRTTRMVKMEFKTE
jgi:hypothetical protein